ncbi:G-protein coupled receptor 15-like [Protopterus annectens]|uniref:G-protein coupled receptor 15-like n=1 Tax=Protopterus annectens TaxID=7888 RepID=UPI001CF9A344|nr:G-protein coupled receptor 15-like [Protopterus annectens]
MSFSTISTSIENYEYEGNSTELDCEPFPSYVADIILPLLYSLMFIIGISGNSVLMIILLSRKNVKRLIDIFIINLALSDFIFLLTLPFWIDFYISQGNWRVGSFLCKFSTYVIALNMYSSVFFLTCMSFDRYLAIVHPCMSRAVRTRLHASYSCIFVWILAMVLAIPVPISRKVVEMGEASVCTEDMNSQLTGPFTLISLTFAFVLPLIGILGCYCMITKKLCLHYRRAKKQDQRYLKSFKMVFIIIALFVISWVPFNTFKIISTAVRKAGEKAMEEESSSCSGIETISDVGMQVSSPLAFANSCANPIIYYFFDNHMRRNVVRFLCRWRTDYLMTLSLDTSSSHLNKSQITNAHGNQDNFKKPYSKNLTQMQDYSLASEE